MKLKLMVLCPAHCYRLAINEPGSEYIIKRKLKRRNLQPFQTMPGNQL
jgi:hypothetical protein